VREPAPLERHADDPTRDFRARYDLPEHFLWDRDDRRRIQYDGYASLALPLLPPPPLDVLDAGCGDGFLSRRLQAAGYAVTGVDYSERAIGFARLVAAGAVFRAADLRDLASAPVGRFGAALLVEVLEHVPPADHARVLAGLHRALRPRGTLVISVPSIHLRPINRWHYKHFSLDELHALLAGAGFDVDAVVCQRRPSALWSPWVWRLVQNRIYDLRIARTLLRRVLLARRNVTDNPGRAGRYILRGVRRG
jgi:SAM-dependent methyltransferase